MSTKDKFKFYVGISIDDDRRLDNYIKYLLSINIPIELSHHNDEGGGYYTYVIIGNWETYSHFQGVNFIKSLTHEEEV